MGGRVSAMVVGPTVGSGVAADQVPRWVSEPAAGDGPLRPLPRGCTGRGGFPAYRISENTSQRPRSAAGCPGGPSTAHAHRWCGAPWTAGEPAGRRCAGTPGLSPRGSGLCRSPRWCRRRAGRAVRSRMWVAGAVATPDPMWAHGHGRGHQGAGGALTGRGPIWPAGPGRTGRPWGAGVEGLFGLLGPANDDHSAHDWTSLDYHGAAGGAS